METCARNQVTAVAAPKEPSGLALLCWLAARAWAVGAALGFLLLVAVAVTWRGRLAAFALLWAGLLPLLLTQAWVDRARRWRRAGFWCGATLLGLLATLVLLSPDGTGDGDGRVRASFTGSAGRFQRLAPGNLVPEVDQLMACYTMMVAADPLFTARQAAQLKAWTCQIYTELDGDPAFARLPSAMPAMYAEALGLSPTSGHTFVYVPSALDRAKAAPVLVFFHGSGGNFKTYLWLLAKVADGAGLVVVAPSLGMGNWRLPETEAAFDQALRAAGEAALIDATNIHVAGLSNGGLAVSQLMTRRGTQLRSAVFLSPVFDGERIGSVDFALCCRAKPILVLTGQSDDRVPLPYVETAVASIGAAGAAPELESVPGADHFLFFSHREQVIARLLEWMRRHGATGP